MKNFNYRKSAIPAAILLSICSQAGAQSNENRQIEEVIVTAQKRAESVQDIPIAIAAYTGNQLTQNGVENSLDLQMIDPSLVLTTNTAAGQPYLRGIGTDVATPGLESSIATFVDDVYMSRSTSALQDFFDIQRIDVVKGPQGVLFGRNAVGGAVNIYTNQPSDELEASTSISVGNYNKRRLEGMVNIPLSDSAKLRVSGLQSKRDGYFKNLAGTDVENDDFYAVRAQLAVDINESADILFAANITREDSTRNLGLWIDTDYGFSIAGIEGANRPTSHKQVSLNEDGFVISDSDSYSMTANVDFEGFSLKSISAYRETNTLIKVDLDGSEFGFASNTQPIESETFTQELQIISNNDSDIEWVAGVFALSEEAQQTLNIVLQFPDAYAGLNDNLTQPHGVVNTKSYGVFGNVKYHINDELSLSAGLRYNYDKRKLDFIQNESIISTGVVHTSTVVKLNDTYNDTTPRLIFEYTPNDDSLIYLSASKGYKAGGYNAIVPQTQGVNPEQVWAYEVGLKTTLLEGSLQVNSAAFYYDYTDMQINTIPEGGGSFQQVLNAGESVVQGFEFDATYLPTNNLELRLAGQYLDAEFKKLNATDGSGRTASNGGQMPRAPELSISLSAEYNWYINDRELKLSATARHESEQYLDIFQDQAVQRDDNTLINARLSYEINDDISLALWGRNITDEETVQSSIRADGLFGVANFYSAPRTYGLTLDVNF